MFLASVGCYRLLIYCSLLFINNCLIKVDVMLFHSRGGFVQDILSQIVDKLKKKNNLFTNTLRIQNTYIMKNKSDMFRKNI